MAATPFFWDDFDREGLYDSTIGWIDSSVTDVSIDNGSLVFRPLSKKPLPTLSADLIENLTEFRLNTTIRYVNAASGQDNPNFILSVWNSEISGHSDWSSITSNGNYGAAVTDNGIHSWTEESLAPHSEVVSNDISWSVVFDDSVQAVNVWFDGTQPNADRTVPFDRVTSEIDVVGLQLNPSSTLAETILVRHFAILPLLDGDYNASGNLDVGDVDLMADQLRSPDPDRVRVFDVNGDGETDLADHAELVTQVIGTSLGDANLDGEVAFDDFLALSTEFGKDGNWAQGDFDANGKIEFADFLLLSENFGASPAVASVPEPSGLISCLSIMLGLLALRRMR